MASLLGVLENEKLGTKDLKKGFGGVCCYYIYIYFNRKENGKFANLI